MYAVCSKFSKKYFVTNTLTVVNNLLRNYVQTDVILSVISKSFNSKQLHKIFQIGKVKTALLQGKFSYLALGFMLQLPNQSIQNYKKTNVEQEI